MQNPIIKTVTNLNYGQNTIPYSTQIVRNMLYQQEQINYMEIWNFINNASTNIGDSYHISNFGRVFSTKANKILNYSISDGGYARVGVRTFEKEAKLVLVHRAVLLAFNYNPYYKELECNHIDGNKLNNFIYNLEWVTRKENAEHASRENLYLKGMDAPGSLYSDYQIRKICEGLMQRLPHETIAKNAGIIYNDSVRSTIVQIKRGKAWKHISLDYDFPKEPSYQMLSDAQVHEICRIIDSGTRNYIDILDMIGIDFCSLTKDKKVKYSACMRQILNGKRYTNISKNYKFYKYLMEE